MDHGVCLTSVVRGVRREDVGNEGPVPVVLANNCARTAPRIVTGDCSFSVCHDRTSARLENDAWSSANQNDQLLSAMVMGAMGRDR